MLHEKSKYDVNEFNKFIEALDIFVINTELSKAQIQGIIHLYSYFHKAIIYSLENTYEPEIELPAKWREQLEEFDIVINKIFIDK